MSDKKKTFYITTPLYYVNDVPHIGHAYSTVGADVLARYKRAQGVPTVLQTGTDEHGQKVARAAEEKGKASPRELVDEVVVHYQDLWKLLNISHDRFYRTTSEAHYRAASEFFDRVRKAGFLEKRSYSGWYCVHEETFWPETQLKQPGNLCPDCERPAQQQQEENWFFLQTAFVEKMRAFMKDHPDFVQPKSRRNEILGSYLEAEGGVHDISVTRSTVSWGIPVPGDEKQVLYVWFDALINYLAGCGWPDGDSWEESWPADVHIIGKDILRFHAVMWPAMLLAAGVEAPRKVFGTGFIVNDGKKMSKSFGNVIDPARWVERFGADVVRYYILREVPFGQDGSVSDQGIQDRYDKELANDLGNLLNRSLNMLSKYFDGKVPAPSAALDGSEFVARARGMWDAYSKEMDALAFHQALEKVFEVVRDANAEIDRQAPWKLAKDESKKQELADCLYSLAETLRIVWLALWPFMPEKAAAAFGQLGLDATSLFEANGAAKESGTADLSAWGGLKEGHALQKGEPLFPRETVKA